MAHYTKSEEILGDYYEYLEINKNKALKQIKNQDDGIQIARKRFDDKLNDASYGDGAVGSIVVADNISVLSDFISSFLSSNKNNRSGAIKDFFNHKITVIPNDFNKLKEPKTMNSLKIDDIAFVALKSIINNIDLNNMDKPKHMRTTAIDITNKLIILISKSVIKHNFGGWENALISTMRTKHQRKMIEMYQRSVRLLKEQGAKVNVPTLSTEEKFKIGSSLINMVISLGLIEINNRRMGKKTINTLKFTEKVLNNNNILEDILRNKEGFTFPMIIKPKPWTDVIGGGFLTNDDFDTFGIDTDFDAILTPFIRTNNKEAIKNIRANNMDKVYEAVNSAQETAWKVNDFVFAVVNTIWNNNLELGGIIKSSPTELPAKPFDIDTNEDNRRDWKRKSALIHNDNADTISERMTFQYKLNIVNKVKDEEEIFFPHNIDYRNRIYPINVLFNPQGDDVSKALLKFKNGKALGKDGFDWLLIHAANVWGYDKESFENRKQWSLKRIDMFKEILSNPYQNTEWEEADKPFQFLAVIKEIVLAYELDNKSEFISYIPVALDGSCSGIQHWSAILRDAIGGKGVNLMKSDKPNDIYMDVVNELIILLKADNSANSLMWLNSGYINRKLAKRPVMTVPYGVKKMGMKDQLIEVLKSNKDINELYFKNDMINHLLEYMETAINNIVIAARDAMEYFQSLGKKYIKQTGKTISWKTPLGFSVTQSYYKTNRKQIKTILGGATIKTSDYSDTDEVNVAKQINGIAPNIIHSLDATHLMMTVNVMAENDIEDFSLIHDSFGTHACNTSLAHAMLKEQFVELYTGDIFSDIKNEILKGEVIDLEEPKKGTLNINEVLLSDYLFA